jgi:hypothetical protein
MRKRELRESKRDENSKERREAYGLTKQKFYSLRRDKIMSSFLKTASKQVADVRNFLRESAGGNSIKYSAEKGAKHLVYIPYTTEEVIDEATNTSVMAKQICAISGKVHEWQTADGKFKATICLDGVIRRDDAGNLINSGTCPLCERISDAWDIYNYRKEQEELTCVLTGDNRKNYLEKTLGTFRDERKAKEAKNYMYILIAKFKYGENGREVIGTDGLPEYEIKVMKLSSSRVEKIQQQIMNSGAELADSELIFEYPNTEDRRLQVSGSTTTPVFPQNKLTAKYPGVLDKINQDIAKFDWEGIEKAFPEWSGMADETAKSTMDSAFEKWDQYVVDRKINPQAKYLEYVVETPTAKPSLGIEGGPAIPTIPTIPTVPNVAPAPQVANTAAPVPTVPTVDPNAVFAGGATAPAINV